jgi:hypothetical protein
MRVVMTRVLPVPAPASTSSGPSVVSNRLALRGVERREQGIAGDGGFAGRRWRIVKKAPKRALLLSRRGDRRASVN